MKKKKISIKYTRDNLADIVNDVAYGGNEYLVTKFGKVVAEIKPVKKVDRTETNKEAVERRQKAISNAFGIWKDRWPKNKTSVEIVQEMRDEMFRKRLGNSYGNATD